jgi:F0F1-type ATP synthase membrane subunit c/vacuolar-type H+-ATPase subunit K
MNRSLPTIIVALALILAGIPAGFRPGSASSPAARQAKKVQRVRSLAGV